MLGNHLLGLYEKALPPGLRWEERLLAAKELGFDYLEISIDETDERLSRLDWTAEQRRELHRALLETGVPIQSMCLSAHRRHARHGDHGHAAHEQHHPLPEV